jgi:pSer/pThr/pTyr-binding forkhead associated (FHA) protein
MNQVYKIGRDIDNNLVLDDKLVESFHAHLYINDNDELVLLDLKSKYGSLVNGARVSECILRAEDQLQIGFSRIDWLKIDAELRANQKKITGVKKMPAKVFSEIETNYSGEASFKLATEALQMEIAPKVIPITEKPAVIEVPVKPEKPENTIEDEIISLISEQLNVPPISIEIPSEVSIPDAGIVPDPISIPVSPPITEPISVSEPVTVSIPVSTPIPDSISDPVPVSASVSIPTSLPVSVLEININTAYNTNTPTKARNKKSFEETISNVDSLYLFLIIILLTMFFLGWVISIIT